MQVAKFRSRKHFAFHHVPEQPVVRVNVKALHEDRPWDNLQSVASKLSLNNGGEHISS